MNLLPKLILIATISLPLVCSAADGTNETVWFRTGNKTNDLPPMPPPPLPLHVEQRIDMLEREVATKLAAKEGVVTRQEHEANLVRIQNLEHQLMLLTQPALQQTNKITPKSKFTGTCPYCGAKKVKSNMVLSRASTPIGNDKFRVTWEVQFHCTSCTGNFSEPKDSVISRSPTAEQIK